MLISHHQEDIGDFHIRDVEMTHKVQSRSRCTFINWAIAHIFVHMHTGPRSNHSDGTGHFHFRDLEMTPSRSSEVNFWRILKLRYQLPNSVS